MPQRVHTWTGLLQPVQVNRWNAMALLVVCGSMIPLMGFVLIPELGGAIGVFVAAVASSVAMLLIRDRFHVAKILIGRSVPTLAVASLVFGIGVVVSALSTTTALAHPPSEDNHESDEELYNPSVPVHTSLGIGAAAVAVGAVFPPLAGVHAGVTGLLIIAGAETPYVRHEGGTGSSGGMQRLKERVHAREHRRYQQQRIQGPPAPRYRTVCRGSGWGGRRSCEQVRIN